MDPSIIPLTDEFKLHLVRIIEQTKSQPLGYVFEEPVDYVNLGLQDYLQICPRPMDLSTLKSQLYTYKTLGAFIRDADLIWENCRLYNGMAQDGFYFKAACDIEKYFVNQLCKIKEFSLTPTLYYKIVGRSETNQPKEKELITQEFTVTQVQQLIKRLQELPEIQMIEVLKWYAKTKGVELDINQPQFQLSFEVADDKLLRALEQQIAQKK